MHVGGKQKYMNVLQTIALTKTFRSGAGIFDIEITIKKGEACGLLGVEGAGKSTVLKAVLGLIRPSSGKVVFSGKEVKKLSPVLLQNTGYLPGNYDFYTDLSGKEFLGLMGAGRKVDASYRDDVLKTLSVPESDLKKKVWKLSPNGQQKLALTAALQHKPLLLVLDEPVQRLTISERDAVYGLIHRFKDEGGAVLLASKSVVEVEKFCSQIAFLHQGRIVSRETVDTLRSKSLYNITLAMTPPLSDKFLEKLSAAKMHRFQDSVHFQVPGDIKTLLLKFLDKGDMKDLEITRSPLDDVYEKFYARGEEDA